MINVMYVEFTRKLKRKLLLFTGQTCSFDLFVMFQVLGQEEIRRIS